jgi:hypothetical protein
MCGKTFAPIDVASCVRSRHRSAPGRGMTPGIAPLLVSEDVSGR